MSIVLEYNAISYWRGGAGAAALLTWRSAACRLFAHINQLVLQAQFEALARTRIKNKRYDATPVNAQHIIQRHAGVLGLCACVQAFPYDVPEVVPRILMTLSAHLDDPQPIQVRQLG